ncbi:(S)-benzoin forming benzil reductase [Rossellomorea aquimaris]|uniref:(S)-benzoin forming benzil reductase n=1 Tax=Rossellomorea TaxID=2837508 RepID=UPI001CD591E7|nr:(S)-benzoin forming benzil reductase [Rossellomorea aquimaris]MCA1061503.1 (S)-benzoin forming benzil reductase [Rossellomorea aquimaris]
MDYAIVTGATRGLGESIAKGFIEKGIGVMNISRTDNESLQRLAREKEVSYEFFHCDLSQTVQTESVFREVGARAFKSEADSIYVVQNAGVVTPINPSGEVDTGALEMSVHVNLLSPMIATNELIKAAEGSSSKMTMVNISSGAGSRPVYGWSTYCATKAGVNMLTETVSLELTNKHSRHQVIAFSPGVMDTDMQGEIRSSSKESFADVESFQRYKDEGMLRSTDTVADVLLKLITESEIESGKLYHVNDLL